METEVSQRLWIESRAAIGGSSPQRGAASARPVSNYLDGDRLTRELKALRRLPIPVAPLANLAAPGDWLTCRVHDVPLLLTRDASGSVRAFINVCRHRGAIVAPEESAGSGRSRFVCPYHSWTYDACGRNVGRPHAEEFPHVPQQDANLVAVPCAQRMGQLWVVPAPMAAFDWDGYFGPLADEVEALGYDGFTVSPRSRRFSQPSNWKLVLEGNLESYHFQYAHRQTIAHLFHDNLVVQESFGDHQRIVLPKRSMAAAPEDAPAQLLGRHSNVIFFFFPCAFLLWEGDHIDVFTASPAGVAASDMRGWMLVPQALAGKPQAHWDANYDIFWRALDEDFALAASIQSGLASGANQHMNFGTSEFACELFNQSLDRALASVR